MNWRVRSLAVSVTCLAQNTAVVRLGKQHGDHESVACAQCQPLSDTDISLYRLTTGTDGRHEKFCLWAGISNHTPMVVARERASLSGPAYTGAHCLASQAARSEVPALGDHSFGRPVLGNDLRVLPVKFPGRSGASSFQKEKGKIGQSARFLILAFSAHFVRHTRSVRQDGGDLFRVSALM